MDHKGWYKDVEQCNNSCSFDCGWLGHRVLCQSVLCAVARTPIQSGMALLQNHAKVTAMHLWDINKLSKTSHSIERAGVANQLMYLLTLFFYRLIMNCISALQVCYMGLEYWLAGIGLLLYFVYCKTSFALLQWLPCTPSLSPPPWRLYQTLNHCVFVYF